MSQATLSSKPYLNSNLFSGHYLDERIGDLDDWECDDAAREAFDELRRLWDLEGDLTVSYNEDELLDSWIDEVLDVLGFGTLSETTLPDGGGYNDRLLFESDERRRDAALRKKGGDVEAMYGLSAAILEAKQWDADFSRRFAEQRSYRDASHQIKYYLEHTPESVDWGVLTDGRKWRLYGTRDYATETYYEIDLPELLESGDLDRFKYFYAFFRPAAFRETAGATFLDTVWNESETAAQELGEDLQDNVFTALRILGEGFVETNDLDIDPEDEAARDRLKEQSLVLLYRLMFVLYAESRGLIHPDDPTAQSEYEEHFSLDQLRLEIHEDIESGESFEDYSEFSTTMWSRLQDLFGLVDAGEQSLGIPPYNGGLFDDEEHEFLADNEVSDRHIAEIVYRLGTTESADGSFVLADYADLDTRHLGSIYEGLLEHEFRIAPEQYAAVAEDGGQVWQPATEVSVADAVETVEPGELYVVNDDGERKATGAYYTPDYVVSYIVEETVDPLLDDIKADLEADGLEPSDREYFARFWQAVKDLKILDPAMGSAHFLTSATGYLTEQVMEVVREQEIQSYDEQHLRREIAKECVYGVDVNGMAVELGKLSMWLETLASDQPLAFLDHHLKTGNSLVGSDITEVLADDTDEAGGQLTLTQVAARVRRDTLGHVMDLMADLLAIDNETLADVKSMEDLYDEIRADPLYQRLFEIAHVHTAEAFGLDLPADVYEELARAIEDAEEWDEIRTKEWFQAAQSVAAAEAFFHWELEFPEVFFDADGERRDDAGFDAVVGNPPYVSAWNRDLGQDEFLRTRYSSAAGHYDIYCLFIEKAATLVRPSGGTSMIVPDTLCGQAYAENCRETITNRLSLTTVLDLRDRVVFDDAQVDNIVFAARGAPDRTDAVAVANIRPGTEAETETTHTVPYSLLSADNEYRIPLSEDALALGIREKTSTGVPLDDAFYVSKGMEPHTADGGSKYGFIEKEAPADRMQEYVEGKHISRWRVHSNWFIDYTPDEHKAPAFRDLFEARKIVGARTIGDGRPLFAVDERGYYTNEKVLNAVPYTELETAESDNSQVDISEENLRYGEKFSLHSVVCVLNSNLTTFVFREIESGALDFFPRHLKKIRLPVPDTVPAFTDREELAIEDRQQVRAVDLTPSDCYRSLHECGVRLRELHDRRSTVNTSLSDHLGAYSDGHTLADIGLTQPPEGSADSVLQRTTTERPNLRVGRAEVVRESDSTVEIRLTARYKPDDEDSETRPEGGSRNGGTGEARGTDHETDQWGYTETDPLPALRITDLSAGEADLIEAFVPVAVDEAGGFAGFRETATKTNSLIDRLRNLTLPALSDVREELESYRETTARAEELEAQIEHTDELIDEIVYELYGLTDEEIEIVEDAVGE
jgi:hypothetical protein